MILKFKASGLSFLESQPEKEMVDCPTGAPAMTIHKREEVEEGSTAKLKGIRCLE